MNTTPKRLQEFRSVHAQAFAILERPKLARIADQIATNTQKGYRRNRVGTLPA
jgi:hypothetical protein